MGNLAGMLVLVGLIIAAVVALSTAITVIAPYVAVLAVIWLIARAIWPKQILPPAYEEDTIDERPRPPPRR